MKTFKSTRKQLSSIVSSFIMILLISTSCQDDTIDDMIHTSSRVRVSQSLVALPYKATQITLAVNSSEAWTIEIDCDWLSANVDSGVGNQTVIFSSTINETEENRETIVLVKISDTEYASVKVTQVFDNRVFLDVSFSGNLAAQETATDAKLLIPYTIGNGESLKSISASVTGEVCGTLTIEKKDIILDQGSGCIELIVSGRPSAPGIVCFTVTGIADLYGESAQCNVEVTEGTPVTVKSIFDVRALKTTGQNVLISGYYKIVGQIVSDKDYGNVASNMFVIVDSRQSNSGIIVKLPSTHSFTVGSNVDVLLHGSTLTESDGVLVVNVGANDDVISKITADYSTASIEITPQDMPNYESMYVKILNTQVDNANISKPTLSGNTIMELYGGTSTYGMYVYPSATLASTALKTGSGTLYGIVEKYNDSYALFPRNPQDIEELTNTRFGAAGASLSVSTQQFTGISELGDNNLSFSVSSTVDWTVSTSDTWITDITPVNGTASLQPQTVMFKVSANSGAARQGKIIVKGVGLSDVEINVEQNANTIVYYNDFSGVLDEMSKIGSSSTFPGSLTTDYSSNLTSLGLEGWTISPCYLSKGKDGMGMIRTGATSVSGSAKTGAFTALGDTPTDVTVTFLAGLQNKAYNDMGYRWIEVRISGDGTLQSGVHHLTANDDTYTANKVTQVPAYLVTGLDNVTEKLCTIVISGATKNTQLEFKSTNAANHCFLIGNVRVTKQE